MARLTTLTYLAMPQDIPDAWPKVGTILASATVLRVRGYKAFFDASFIATQPVDNSKWT